MTRNKFITKLRDMWDERGREEATLEDLLDDAATIGLEGASEAYFAEITPTPNPKMSPGT